MALSAQANPVKATDNNRLSEMFFFMVLVGIKKESHYQPQVTVTSSEGRLGFSKSSSVKK
jgi:hypothetical protein